jgi:ferric citrate transport system permease protein
VTAVPASGAGAASAALARRVRTAIAFAAFTAIAIGGFVWSVSIGPDHIGFFTIVKGTFVQGHTTSQLIIHLIRLPRALLAVLAGAALAVSGAVMQSVTRNPLGAPEILGVTYGAAVTVALVTTIVPSMAGVNAVWLSFAGGGAAAILVYCIARYGRGGMSPARLALAGYTITLMLWGVLQGLLIAFTQDSDKFFFWLVGGVTTAEWRQVHAAYPWLVGGFVLAILLARPLNLLALGDDVAKGLGQNVGRTRFLAILCVVVLTGAAVGVAGPIAFVGLIVPHIVRKFVGQNHFVVLPLSMIVGAALVLYADIAVRHLDPHVAMPCGILVAPIGAALFIYLARREKVV